MTSLWGGLQSVSRIRGFSRSSEGISKWVLWSTGWCRKDGKGHLKISCLTSWTRSWKEEGTGSAGTQTCNVYVKTQRAGQRVFDSIGQFLWKRLKLRVNREKSAVAPCHERGFLGFSFTKGRMLKIKLSLKALQGVKRRIKAISRRSRGVSLEQMIQQLNTYLEGWMQYYRLVETPTVFTELDSWIRRRLRCFMAKQWINNCHTRYKNLVAMGVYDENARLVAGSRKGPCPI